LLAGVWKRRGNGNNVEKVRCLLCLDKDVKTHIVEIFRNWKMEKGISGKRVAKDAQNL
jgi:hypothetical protein